MKKKQWYVEIDLDAEPKSYDEVTSWFEGVCKLLAIIQEGVPFVCKVDFFYRDGDRE